MSVAVISGMPKNPTRTSKSAPTEVAAERNLPGAQVALAWLLGRPGVTAPIVGATKIGHVEDALAAESLRLTSDEVARLEEPYVPHAISGHE